MYVGPPLEESIFRPTRNCESICRDIRRGGERERILFTFSKELSIIQTEVSPVLKSGMEWRNQVDIDSETNKAFYVRFREAWFRIHRYYWDLILNKSEIGLNYLSVESAEERE